MIIYVYLIFFDDPSVHSYRSFLHNQFSVSLPVECTLRVLPKIVEAARYPRSTEMEKRELGERADDERGGGRISRAE